MFIVGVAVSVATAVGAGIAFRIADKRVREHEEAVAKRWDALLERFGDSEEKTSIRLQGLDSAISASWTEAAITNPPWAESMRLRYPHLWQHFVLRTRED